MKKLLKIIAHLFVLLISRVFWEWGFTWGAAFLFSLVEWIDLILSTMAMENLPLSVGGGGSGVGPSRPLLDLNFPPHELELSIHVEEADPAGGANPQNPGIDREPPRQQRGAEEREIDPAGWASKPAVEEFIHEAKQILALEKEITGRVGKETGYPVPNLE